MINSKRLPRFKKCTYTRVPCIVTKDYGDGHYDLEAIKPARNGRHKKFKRVWNASIVPTYEKRMYFFVMYNLSGIQKGIQAGHAAIEYARYFGMSSTFRSFAEFDKTFILLDGGTSNMGSIALYGMEKQGGSMEEIQAELQDIAKKYRYLREFNFAGFREPDANWSLTALAFILDERTFDYETYPDFAAWLSREKSVEAADVLRFKLLPPDSPIPAEYMEWHDEWLRDVMGDVLNVRLREVIRGRKKA